MSDESSLGFAAPKTSSMTEEGWEKLAAELMTCGIADLGTVIAAGADIAFARISKTKLARFISSKSCYKTKLSFTRDQCVTSGRMTTVVQHSVGLLVDDLLAENIGIAFRVFQEMLYIHFWWSTGVISLTDALVCRIQEADSGTITISWKQRLDFDIARGKNAGEERDSSTYRESDDYQVPDQADGAARSDS